MINGIVYRTAPMYVTINCRRLESKRCDSTEELASSKHLGLSKCLESENYDFQVKKVVIPISTHFESKTLSFNI